MAKKIIDLIEVNDFEASYGFGHGTLGIKYTINNIAQYIHSEKLKIFGAIGATRCKVIYK